MSRGSRRSILSRCPTLRCRRSRRSEKACCSTTRLSPNCCGWRTLSNRFVQSSPPNPPHPPSGPTSDARPHAPCAAHAARAPFLSSPPARPRARREKTVRRRAPACRLETLVALHAVENLPAEEVAAATLELAAKTFSSNLELLTALERRVLPQRLQEHAAACLLSLANEQLAGFIQSASSNASVNSLQLGIERPFGSSSHLLWGRYKAPSKFVGWLYALVRVADQIPVSIAVSDMQVAAYIRWSFWTRGVSCRGSSAQPISITALLLRAGWIVMCRWLGCPWCMSTRSSARSPVTLNWRHRGRTAASYRWSGGVVG